MKTALMFAGIDSLDNPIERSQCLQLKSLKANIKKAEEVIFSHYNVSLDLLTHFESSQESFQSDIVKKTINVTIAQVSLFEDLVKNNFSYDYLVGCSLGDSARSICSGSLSFENVIAGVYLFSTLGSQLNSGFVVRCRKINEPFEASDHEEIINQGVFLVVSQTPHHFLVGGKTKALSEWVHSEKEKNRYNIKPMLNLPLHTPLMNEVTQLVYEKYKHAEMNLLATPMISSVLKKIILTEEELRTDVQLNMANTVFWHETFCYMVEELKIKRFINIGPVTTLIEFAKRSALADPFELIQLDLKF